jgi:organic radical activating enzyme
MPQPPTLKIAEIFASIQGEGLRQGEPTIFVLQQSRPAEWVVLTGGEPLMQDVGPLTRRLKSDGFRIQIETNGVFYRRLPADWYTVSPKPPAYAFHPEYLSRAREVKLVASRELTYAVVARIRDAFPPAVPLLLQPESNTAASRAKALRLLRRAAKEGRTNVRLSLQMHKILRLP